jgi:phosphatidylglycerol:prolipoprotein diacylglycerol transferase
VAYRAAKTQFATPSIVVDAAFWALVGGILGGRVGYVIANWAYFHQHIDQALDVTGGGLSWHGALLGAGVIAVAWWVLRARFSTSSLDWRDLMDALAPGLALGSAFGWVGCLLTGAAYGAEAAGYAPPLSWLTADLRDIYGVDEIRFATQPLMIAWCLLLWAALHVLHRLPKCLPRGARTIVYLGLYALADFGVMFLRGDGTWRSGLWLSQWLDIAEMALVVALGTVLWTRRDKWAARPLGRETHHAA